MIQIISLLITTGGLGFANVLFLERVGILTFDNHLNNDRFLWLVIFSSLNYTTFIYTRNIWITILISIVITLAVPLFNYKPENKVRSLLHKSKATDKHAWDVFWDEAGVQPLVIILDVHTNNVIDAGYLFAVTRSVDSNHEVALNIYEHQNGLRSLNYQEVIDWAKDWREQDNQYASMYIDNNRKYIALSTFTSDD